MNSSNNSDITQRSKDPMKTSMETSGNSSDDMTDSFYERMKGKANGYVSKLRRTHKFQRESSIETGYRTNYNTLEKCIRSIFHIHNETTNIWTHLSFFIIMVIIITIMAFQPNVISMKDKVILTVEDKFTMMKHELSQYESSIEIRSRIDSLQNNLQGLYIAQFEEIKKSESVQHIQERLDVIKNQLIEKIDSEDYDWTDIKMLDTRDAIKNHHVSRWPIFVFMVAAMICLFNSTVYHMFLCKNEKYFNRLLKLDYSGISLLISGSTLPPYYYGFYCHFHYAVLYITLVGSASLIVFFLSMMDWYSKPEWRPIRAKIQGGLGIFAAVGLIQLIILGVDSSNKDTFSFMPSCLWYGLMGFSYLAGLTILERRWPEKNSPKGKYDIIGQSHNIWHMCVIVAIIFTYIAAQVNFQERKMSVCPEN